MKKHVILFLATNAEKTDQLALDQEARAIHVELSRSGYRDCFELVTRWATEPLDLLRELRRFRPTVVHFRGHGMHCTGSAPPSDECSTLESTMHNGMYFRGIDGRAHFVSAAALRRTFSAVGRCVKLVVLNICHDEVHAEATFPYADCVIGMQSSAQDGATRNFAIGFYGALGERESITTAYEQGCAAISLEGDDDCDRPRLWVRDGIDAGQIVLAAELRQRRARNRERATTMRRADHVFDRRGQRSAAGPTMASGRTQRSKSSPVT